MSLLFGELGRVFDSLREELVGLCWNCRSKCFLASMRSQRVCSAKWLKLHFARTHSQARVRMAGKTRVKERLVVSLVVLLSG
jgi:hypothetical protein